LIDLSSAPFDDVTPTAIAAALNCETKHHRGILCTPEEIIVMVLEPLFHLHLRLPKTPQNRAQIDTIMKIFMGINRYIKCQPYLMMVFTY
jgi:hypothetical protein